ncbi:hypothetical protein K388_01915 [Streptomyces sp. KhCrAH-43]|uniref:hypothetical protein n=1 Tax=unclassified Streptomyces TaxID=2593676 RepID=UPI00037462E6|nr:MULTISPECIES: hypothetical protein [unclassified Streptomyces]MYS34916.1 hypothetical protein [Streptomyces sp. SID4920]MYX65307.1 hypothetical protein [Streptomyces sp. SID8373]RAJ64720.1 hypothetical protein K388_01915 [Streptomyces sp. KhCrAH-43]
MDEGDAAVWAAGIGAVSALAGAAIGYFAGRLQAKATLDGVKIQLAGQRNEAIWQAKVDAYAAVVAEFNQVRMLAANFVALLDADRREGRLLREFGYGTPEEAMGTLTEQVKACVFQENVLRLRVSASEADAVTNVRTALSELMSALGPWAVARTGGPGNASALKREVDQRMATFRDMLDSFVADAQNRLAHPRSEWLYGEDPDQGARSGSS